METKREMKNLEINYPRTEILGDGLFFESVLAKLQRHTKVITNTTDAANVIK